MGVTGRAELSSPAEPPLRRANAAPLSAASMRRRAAASGTSSCGGLLGALEELSQLRDPLVAYEDEPLVVAASDRQHRLRFTCGVEQPLAVRERDDVVLRTVDDEYRCSHIT